MPKIKVPRSSPSLDMTPMVDLAFLLVTFFMLTAQFRASEPVIVDTPSSGSDKILPDNMLLVTVDSAGRAFFNIDGVETRKMLLLEMGKKYNMTFDSVDVHRFSVMTSFGVPMAQLKEYIRMDDYHRTKVVSPGIPMDSTNNELGDWIINGWKSAQIQAKILKDKGEDYKELRFAIKGDGHAEYGKIKRVMDVFMDKKIYNFNMVTDLETE